MLIDTNIILRWLLADHETLTPKAQTLIDSATTGELLITDIVLAEVFYVLRGKHYPSHKIADVFSDFKQQPAFSFDNDHLLALQIEILSTTSLDFADCYLIARAIRAKQPLKTFDKQMQKTYDKYKAVR